MNAQILIDTASKLVADHKCLLAMDESNLASKRSQRKGSAASLTASGKMQPRRAPWRIHRRDGKGITSGILQITARGG
jgi:hypothetical protein